MLPWCRCRGGWPFRKVLLSLQRGGQVLGHLGVDGRPALGRMPTVPTALLGNVKASKKKALFPLVYAPSCTVNIRTSQTGVCLSQSNQKNLPQVGSSELNFLLQGNSCEYLRTCTCDFSLFSIHLQKKFNFYYLLTLSLLEYSLLRGKKSQFNPFWNKNIKTL